MKIVIVDYGMGNKHSITSALKYIGVQEVVVSHKSEDLQSADKLLLPGVGAFNQAMINIQKLELDTVLKNLVLIEKKPILGICLGMQLLCESSDEDGLHSGLGFIKGDVRKFDISPLSVPHVGFNQVKAPANSRLYTGLEELSDFYFTHSFRMQSGSPINAGICEYGQEFIASFELDNIAGTQFHPELSQTNGLKVLENFVKSF